MDLQVDNATESSIAASLTNPLSGEMQQKKDERADEASNKKAADNDAEQNNGTDAKNTAAGNVSLVRTASNMVTSSPDKNTAESTIWGTDQTARWARKRAASMDRQVY